MKAKTSLSFHKWSREEAQSIMAPRLFQLPFPYTLEGERAIFQWPCLPTLQSTGPWKVEQPTQALFLALDAQPEPGWASYQYGATYTSVQPHIPLVLI